MSNQTVKPDLYLEFCSSTQVKQFEERHYVARIPKYDDLSPLEKERVNEIDFRLKEGKPRGHHGQQIHFLIWYHGENVGAISGGSPVFGTRSRDAFFGITKDNKKQTLNGVIDNTLFRLENHERNLAVRCMALWRKKVVGYWEYIYGVTPYGFETYVLEEDIERPEKKHRKHRKRTGALYKADNWTFTGRSFGSTKNHFGVGLTGGVLRADGTKKGSFARVKVPSKLEFCRWREGFCDAVYCEYVSSWRGNTPETRTLAKIRADRRLRCLGTIDILDVVQEKR